MRRRRGVWVRFAWVMLHLMGEGFLFRQKIRKQKKGEAFGEDEEKLLTPSPFVSRPLSSLCASLPCYPFTFCFMFHTFSDSLPFRFPSAVHFSLLVSFSISLCTPTRSGVDCHTRRTPPRTLTPCCKSFTECGEVFSERSMYYL